MGQLWAVDSADVSEHVRAVDLAAAKGPLKAARMEMQSVGVSVGVSVRAKAAS